MRSRNATGRGTRSVVGVLVTLAVSGWVPAARGEDPAADAPPPAAATTPVPAPAVYESRPGAPSGVAPIGCTNCGTLPPVAVKEAQADAAAREGDVIFAENRLDLAARTLQYSVMFASGPTGAPAPVRPSERHTVAEQAVDRATLLRTAVERRAEVRAARIEVASATLESRRTRNASTFSRWNRRWYSRSASSISRLRGSEASSKMPSRSAALSLAWW